MLRPPLLAMRSPARVITGTPIQRASNVVVPPAKGEGSRAMSIRPYVAMYDGPS